MKFETLLQNLGSTNPEDLCLWVSPAQYGNLGYVLSVSFQKQRIGSATITNYPSCCGACILSHLDVVGSRQRKGVGSMLNAMVVKYVSSCGYRYCSGISKVSRGQEKFWKTTQFEVSERWRNTNSGNDLVSLMWMRQGRDRVPQLYKNRSNAQYIHDELGGARLRTHMPLDLEGYN